MQIRAVAIAIMAGLTLTGCGVTRTITGEVSPQVAATITLKPAPGAPLSKAETELATNVISARLKTLGVGNFSIAAGNDIRVSIIGGVDVLSAQLAVQAPGVLQFVINLDTDVSPTTVGGTTPGLGPLWQGDEVAAVSSGADSGGQQTISIKLTDAGAVAFAAATASHVGEQLALALDQQVLAFQAIKAPAAGGTTLTFAAPGFMPANALKAILLNGPLPPGWRQA